MFTNIIKKSFLKLYENNITKWCMLILGFIFFIPMLFVYILKLKNNNYKEVVEQIKEKMKKSGKLKKIEEEVREQIINKNLFFGNEKANSSIEKEVQKILEIRIKEEVNNVLKNEHQDVKELKFEKVVEESLNLKLNFILFMVFGLPSFIFILLMSDAQVKYIVERLVMMLFVVVGVTILVFTILYLSPMDSAVNILGDRATEEQVAQFKESYGLDRSYIAQLFDTVKGLLTFDLGKSYLGNDDVVKLISTRFPVTLQLTFISMIISLIIAIPAGIISAIKPYSTVDYIVMLVALIGLSIPGFWLGLILILNFSINTKLLPATFIIGNWKAYIMPTIVLGIGLTASVARMTRSSMLEVISQDYIVTAKAKGLSKVKVVLRHALGNAMIPIITVVGIQFGSMLSGAAVTEKVFNINGIGSFIVDRQFIPDTPVVLAGVIYVAIIVSLVNLFIDILYSFLDPRIKSKIKSR